MPSKIKLLTRAFKSSTQHKETYFSGAAHVAPVPVRPVPIFGATDDAGDARRGADHARRDADEAAELQLRPRRSDGHQRGRQREMSVPGK